MADSPPRVFLFGLRVRKGYNSFKIFSTLKHAYFDLFKVPVLITLGTLRFDNGEVHKNVTEI